MEKISDKKSINNATKDYVSFCVVSENGVSALRCFVKDIKSLEDKEQVIAFRELLEEYNFVLDFSTLEVIESTYMALVNLQDYYLYDEQRFMLAENLSELCDIIEPELKMVCEHMEEIEEILEQQGIKIENGVAVPQDQSMPAVDGGNGRIVEFIPADFDGREYQ